MVVAAFILFNLTRADGFTPESDERDVVLWVSDTSSLPYYYITTLASPHSGLHNHFSNNFLPGCCLFPISNSGLHFSHSYWVLVPYCDQYFDIRFSNSDKTGSWVTMNQARIKYLDQSLFSSKVTVHTHRRTSD